MLIREGGKGWTLPVEECNPELDERANQKPPSLKGSPARPDLMFATG